MKGKEGAGNRKRREGKGREGKRKEGAGKAREGREGKEGTGPRRVANLF